MSELARAKEARDAAMRASREATAALERAYAGDDRRLLGACMTDHLRALDELAYLERRVDTLVLDAQYERERIAYERSTKATQEPAP